MLDYLAEQYGTVPEYPWLRYANYCTFKTPVRQKWYALMMDVKERVLGVDSDRVVDVLNVKADPAQLPALIDNVHYFAGYHMNHKYWLTVVLNDTTAYDRVKQLLDASYQLVEHGKK